MIVILDEPFNLDTFKSEYQENSVERYIINKLSESTEKYKYNTIKELRFELRMRKEIIKSAKDLARSGMDFEVFRDSRSNPQFWERTEEGGFKLKEGVKPSAAINDIFINGSKYGTECATAMVIIYYKALLNIFPEQLFNETFPKIYLMNWHDIDNELKEIGFMQKAKDYLPGDRRYFKNPDVNPTTPEWQGENVIDLNDGLYYGHGIGIYNAETIIKALNENRKEDAKESAFLMDAAGRPNFKRLADKYYSFTT